MKTKAYHNLVKAAVVATTVLFGVTLTAGKIAMENKSAISDALGQGSTQTAGKDPSVKYYKTEFGTIKDLQKESKRLSRDIEAEGIVMLQNNNDALPLKANSKVSLFGYRSINPLYGGRGSSASTAVDANVDLKGGLEQAGLTVNQELFNYTEGMAKSSFGYKYEGSDIPWSKADASSSLKNEHFIGDDPVLQETIAQHGDAAIYIISRTGGEAGDISLKYNPKTGKIIEDKLALEDEEKSILRGLTQMKRDGKIKNIVVLLNATNQIQQKEFIAEDIDVDSILWIGHTGINGFEAVGDIIAGKVSPSGHLIDTFWYNHQDNPVIKNFGVFKYTNRASYDKVMPPKNGGRVDSYGTYVPYQEGVYLGYRYAETRYTDLVMGRPNVGEFDYEKTIYRPFGYGESYADFKLDNLNVEKVDHEYTVSVKVTNTSDKYSGKEVAQIYVQKPFTEDDIARKIEKPAVELVGFAKTDVLAPGASETLTVKVDERNFASYDANQAKTYILSEGDYLLTAAQDAHKAANNFLAHNEKTPTNSPAMKEAGDKSMVYSQHYALDEETYSVSKATNNKITNLFDHSDINKNEHRGDNKLEFLSRTNWAKQLDNKLKLNDEMVDFIMAQQKPQVKPSEGEYPLFGQTKVDEAGKETPTLLIQMLENKEGEKIDYNGEEWIDFLNQLTWEESVKLVTSGLRLTEAVTRLGKPQTLDHNGPCGLTQSYGGGKEGNSGLANELNDPDKKSTPIAYPTVPVLAASYNKDLAARYGHMLGEDALWAGYQGLYGVAVNSHRSPYGGRHFEYWSEDPLLAGQMASELTLKLQEKGCNAYIKHFALNDQESQRFGIQVWSNEQALREISLRPFELCVVEGGAMNAMASFSRIGMEFAPGSHALQTEFLRGELGMKGLVVTDMYNLGYTEEQYINFLMAGTDIPDGNVDPALIAKYAEGYPQVAQQMRTAAHRIMYHTLHSNAMNGFTVNTVLADKTPAWIITLTTVEWIIGVLFAAAIVWGGTTLVLDNKDKFKKILKK